MSILLIGICVYLYYIGIIIHFFRHKKSTTANTGQTKGAKFSYMNNSARTNIAINIKKNGFIKTKNTEIINK